MMRVLLTFLLAVGLLAKITTNSPGRPLIAPCRAHGLVLRAKGGSPEKPSTLAKDEHFTMYDQVQEEEGGVHRGCSTTGFGGTQEACSTPKYEENPKTQRPAEHCSWYNAATTPRTRWTQLPPYTPPLKAVSEHQADMVFRFLYPRWRFMHCVNNDELKKRWLEAYLTLMPIRNALGRLNGRRLFPCLGGVELHPMLLLHEMALRGGLAQVRVRREMSKVALALGIPANHTSAAAALRRTYESLVLPLEAAELPRRHVPRSLDREAFTSTLVHIRKFRANHKCLWCWSDNAELGISKGGAGRAGIWQAHLCRRCWVQLRRELRKRELKARTVMYVIGVGVAGGTHPPALFPYLVPSEGFSLRDTTGELRRLFEQDLQLKGMRETDRCFGAQQWLMGRTRWLCSKVQRLEGRCIVCARLALRGEHWCGLHEKAALRASGAGRALRGEGGEACCVCGAESPTHGITRAGVRDAEWLGRACKGCMLVAEGMWGKKLAVQCKALSLYGRCERCPRRACFGGAELRGAVMTTRKGGRWGKVVPAPDKGVVEPVAMRHRRQSARRDVMLGLRCKAHRRTGDVDVVHDVCEEEGCQRRPVFGDAAGGARATMCVRHRAPGHVDVVHARCEWQGCGTAACYGDALTRKAVRCSTHRDEHHVDIANRRCQVPECRKAAVFGDRHTRVALYCGMHSQPEHVQTALWKCSASGCKAPPTHYEPVGDVATCREEQGVRSDVPTKRDEGASGQLAQAGTLQEGSTRQTLPRYDADACSLACPEHKGLRHVRVPEHGLRRWTRGRRRGPARIRSAQVPHGFAPGSQASARPRSGSKKKH